MLFSALAEAPAAARANHNRPGFSALFITMFYHKLTDQKLTNELMSKHGLQIEGRIETGNSDSATHPNTKIAEIDCNTSTSRPLRLTASSRHLGETMFIINQLKFKAIWTLPHNNVRQFCIRFKCPRPECAKDSDADVPLSLFEWELN